jgi:RNA polymerase sigma factor (sigma-70 family)
MVPPPPDGSTARGSLLRPGALPLDAEMYEKLYVRVRFRLLRILGPCEDMDDVVQSTMERLLKAWRGYRGEGSPEAFADGVALNVARLYLRRRVLTRRIFDMFTEPEDREETRTGTPSDEVQAGVRMQRLYDILDRVAPKKRIAFAMFYFEGKPVKVISEELGINRETVKARIFHARREVMRRASRDPYLREWIESA